MDDHEGTGAGRVVRNSVSGDAVIHGHSVQAQLIESLTLAPAPSYRPPVPRQLPHRNRLFVNTSELTALTEVSAASQLISVSGLGGIG